MSPVAKCKDFTVSDLVPKTKSFVEFIAIASCKLPSSAFTSKGLFLSIIDIPPPPPVDEIIGFLGSLLSIVMFDPAIIFCKVFSSNAILLISKPSLT